MPLPRPDSHPVPNSIGEAVRRLAARLQAASGSPRLDAELLAAYVTGRPRTFLYAHGDEALSPQEMADLDRLGQRRLRGEPVAYLTGIREFWSLPLQVAPGVLVPRPETELLVEQALATLPPDRPARVIDLGTGSGAIALALATERPQWVILATDSSPASLRIARENAQRLGIPNVRFLHSDWFDAVEETGFDLVVGNPPYIAADDPHLEAPELRAEPREALVSARDGLADIEHIAEQARAHLAQDGMLLLEHGAGQGPAVRKLLGRLGYRGIRTHHDLAGLERVTRAVRPAGIRDGAKAS